MYRKSAWFFYMKPQIFKNECLWRFYFGILCIKLKSPEIVEEIELYSVSKSANSVSKLNIENIVAKIKFFLNVRGFLPKLHQITIYVIIVIRLQRKY